MFFKYTVSGWRGEQSNFGDQAFTRQGKLRQGTDLKGKEQPNKNNQIK